MAVVKVIELIGASPNSWEEATQNAVAKAAKTVRNIVGVELISQTAVVEDGRITQYRSDVRLAFVVEEVTEG
jgi:hypothetical protein